jgi:hypothetical protein
MAGKVVRQLRTKFQVGVVLRKRKRAGNEGLVTVRLFPASSGIIVPVL